MRKLNGIVLEACQRHQEAIAHFEHGATLFHELKNAQGEALCNLSIGYMKFKHISILRKGRPAIIVYRECKERIMRAINFFRTASHFYGLSIGYRFLAQIKKALNENFQADLS